MALTLHTHTLHESSVGVVFDAVDRIIIAELYADIIINNLINTFKKNVYARVTG